jgi:hypothetical protein
MFTLPRLWLLLFFIPFTGNTQSPDKRQAGKKLFEQIDNYLQTQIDTAKENLYLASLSPL